MDLLVSMGLSARAGGPRRPAVRRVDAERGEVVADLHFEADHAPSPEAHQEATCGSLTSGGLLLQPAHTELLWIEPQSLRIVHRISHPLFHGLHSATESPDGSVLLTCAGLDSVLEIDRNGVVLRHHWLREGRFEDAYVGVTDFRTVDHDGFDPHSHHPNHAQRVGDDLWVTCFETRECRSITTGRSIPLPESIPHDGRLREGLLWFTQVEGRVIAVDPITLERRVVIDLRTLCSTRRMLGWCRGIEVSGDRLFVGMTMLRSTTHREVLRLLLRGEQGEKLPTRVLEIDLRGPRLVREILLGRHDGGTIYGITRVEA